MKRIIVLGLSLLAVAGNLSAQQPEAKVDSSTTAVDYKIEVYQKENIPFKAPIPYAYVREADVMFEKTVWRMVDLREKQNLPLYYPTAPIGSRVNLVNLLLKGIESGEITPYDPGDDYNEFSHKITPAEVDQYFGAKRDTIDVADEEGNMVRQIRDIARRTDEIKRILIKEKIYFDKKHSILNRVVIGICPIRVYSRDGAEDGAQVEMMKTMWVYMPEARKVLSRHPVFNRFNDAQNISFDDFFMQNRYSGHISKVSNVYNNRDIAEYASGIDALYEAKRIEDEIFDWEQDLWEY
ncbi:MAG: gliding motility protein GldN [Bacteroidales bacterium]|jgi:gliding motility associated protien GldN|nr:gliding motility protein GldN [Bacteroidales bacterium]